MRAGTRAESEAHSETITLDSELRSLGPLAIQKLASALPNFGTWLEDGSHVMRVDLSDRILRFESN